MARKKRRAKGTGSIYKRGRIWWCHYYTREGYEVTESTGETNEDKAREYLDQKTLPMAILDDAQRLSYYKAEIERKMGLAEEMTTKKVLISDILDEYYRRGHSVSITDATKRRNASIVRKFTNWSKENLPHKQYLEELTHKDAQDYLATQREKLLGSTYSFQLETFKYIFKRMESDIFEKCELIRGCRSERTCFSREEIEKIETAIITNKRLDQDWLTGVRLGYLTGQRSEDICTLKWSDVHFEKDQIHFFPLKTQRYGKEVWVPMFPELKSFLLELKSKSTSEYVAPHLYSVYTHHSVKDGFAKILRRAGIESMIVVNGKKRMYKSFHSLRHTFISFAANLGVPIDYIKEITLQSDAIVRKYYHPSSERTMAVMSTISGLIPGSKSTQEKSDTAEVIEVRDYKEEVDVRISKDLYDQIMAVSDGCFEDNLRHILALQKM